MSVGPNLAGQAVLFICRAGREVQGGRSSGHAVIIIILSFVRLMLMFCCAAELQGPESIDQDRHAAGIGELTQERARGEIEGVNSAIAEIADQKGVGKFAETSWGAGHAPG